MNFHYKRLLVPIRKNFIVRNLLSYFKNVYQRTTYANSTLKKQFLQFLPFLLASFITGFVAFLYSKIFTFSEKWSHGSSVPLVIKSSIKTPLYASSLLSMNSSFS